MSTETTNNESVNTVKNITATIKSVRVIAKTDNMSSNQVVITLDQSIPVFRTDATTRLWTETTTTDLSKGLSIVLAVLGDADEQLAMLTSLPINAIITSEKYSKLTDMQKWQMFLAAVLVGSKLELVSELHSEGEIVNDKPMTHNQWFSDIEKILLSKTSKDYIEKRYNAFLED